MDVITNPNPPMPASPLDELTPETRKYYSEVPGRFLISIHEYVENRRAPGHFITKVLENDLQGACAYGDEEALHVLGKIVKYIYNQIPNNTWGSREIVREWLRTDGDGEDTE